MFRRRLLLVRQRNQTLESLQTMVAQTTAHKISNANLARWRPANVKACFDDVHTQKIATCMLDVARKQAVAIGKLEEHAGAIVKLIGCWRQLLSAPGIGKILGATIMLETGPIERFQEAANYASYVRGVKSDKWSNQKKKGSGNRKNGNKYLAWAYVEAANHALRHYPEVQKWFKPKMRTSNRTVAIKALACKLAKAVYYMLRDNIEFDMEKMFGQMVQLRRKP
jgi:transposase